MYIPETHEIVCQKETKFHGILIDFSVERLQEGSKEYQEVLNEEPCVKDRTNENQVFLDGKVFTLTVEENQKYLLLQESDVLKTKTKNVRSYYGEKILCKCGNHQSKDLFVLKEKIKRNALAKSVALDTYPNGATTPTEVYDIWQKINEANKGIINGQHLALANKRNVIYPCEDSVVFSEASNKTIREIRKYLTNYFQQQFSSSKIQNKATAQDFSNFISRIIREVTFENYLQTIERAERGFKDAIAGNTTEQVVETTKPSQDIEVIIRKWKEINEQTDNGFGQYNTLAYKGKKTGIVSALTKGSLNDAKQEACKSALLAIHQIISKKYAIKQTDENFLSKLTSAKRAEYDAFLSRTVNAMTPENHEEQIEKIEKKFDEVKETLL